MRRPRLDWLLPLAALVACTPAPSPVLPTVVPSPPPSVSTPSASSAPSGIPMLTAAPRPLGADHVSFTLHKFLADVGTERDTCIATADGGTEVKAVSSYRDRSATVPLAARYDFAADGSLEEFEAWGSTSRFTTIDERVDARHGAFDVWHAGLPKSVARPSGVVVALSGFAPILGQDLMLRAWAQRGRPATMAMLPDGVVSIESRGKETYDVASKKVTLEHPAVSGLVWGREDAWVDEKGELAALVTRDAEFDHHEAARDGFDALLPQLTTAAGADGVAWLATAAKGAARGAPGVQAFVGATLIDGTGHPAVSDSVVVVDGDRIVAAGARAQVTVPAGATTIDVSGKTIIPGLWDMHAHVEQVEQGVVYLAAGVTSVRDLGNIMGFITGIRDAIDSGKGLGPRVNVEGIVDGAGDAAIGTVRIKKKYDIAPVLDELKRAGCVDVKIYSSIDPDLVKPIVAYAHAHGMGAVGHVPIGMTSQQAIDAGYDSISHISYLFDALLSEKDRRALSREQRLVRLASLDLASPAMTRELASLVAHHVVIDDTLALYEQLFHTEADDAKREPGIAMLPRELRATLGGIEPSLATQGDAAFAKYLALLGELHKRGIVVVPGTDITVPGYSLLRELELYVQAGFTPMEAIQAATIVSARFLHRDKDLGSIEPGKRADLVILAGDPLADIANIRKTFMVVSHGKAYDPATLWKLVGFDAK